MTQEVYITTIAARSGHGASPSINHPAVEPIYQAAVHAFDDLDSASPAAGRCIIRP